MCCSVVFLKSHSISSMFRGTLLDPPFLHHSLLRFLHLHPIRRPFLRCSILRRVHPLPLHKEGYALVDWLNNRLLQVLSPSLSLRSQQRAHSNCPTFDKMQPRRQPWMRLKCSTLFPQEREVSAISFSVSGSQAQFKREETHAGRGSVFKH